MNPPVLSVIVPVHRMPVTLPAAVESIWAAARGISCEVIVIDDGSTDETPRVARELASAGRITTLLTRTASGGPSQARNDGLAVACGEFIGFLDADDLRLPDSYAPQLALLAARPEVSGALGSVQTERMDGSGVPAISALAQLGALVVRRGLFAPGRVGRFEPSLRYGEDVDWLLRARDRGEVIIQEQAVVLRYRRHPGSLTADLAAARTGLAQAVQRSLARRRAPRVSVIIPARNAEAFLAEALESVFAQTEPPAEIIVVDDGSTDATAEVARRQAARGVRLISQVGAGAAAARNAGVAAATGDWLAFLDADDLWPRERMAILRRALAADPEAGAVFGHVRQFVCPRLPAEERARLVCPTEPQAGCASGAMLVRASVFARVGPFQAQWQVGEFIDWHARATEAGVRLLMLPEIVLERRLHASNTGRARPELRQQFVHLVKAALDRRRAAAAPHP